jgi:5'-nucleotidase
VLPVIRDLIHRPWTPGTLWNVNLPNLEPGAAAPPVIFCPLDPMPLPLSFREEEGLWHYDGDYHGRRRQPGSDVDVCFSGQIAVTQISLFASHGQ